MDCNNQDQGCWGGKKKQNKHE